MIQNNNIYRVFKVFLDESLNGFGLREISRKINLGLPSVSKYVRELVGEGLVIERNIHGQKLWFANREGEIFKKHRMADNIISLEKSGLFELLEEKYDYPTIVLFGSYANGENTEKSDIDLCIISEEEGEINLEKFEKIFKREIHVFLFNKKKFKDLRIKNQEIFNNIINGIILRGFLKIK